MALVDYSSSDGDEPGSPPAKRRKGGAGSAHSAGDSDGKPDGKPDGMPPLPSAFHDLYASTVRHSVVDTPSLHQGRKRQTPHVVGNWPSHLYVEWHPSIAQHDKLAELLDEVARELQHDVELHRFLTSDLGAPLPLHISLSRPLSLPTADKDMFLEKVTNAIDNSGLGAFHVAPEGLAWYRSPDSDRTFLILRVASNGSATNDASAPNPELMSLLTRCNTIATLFNQHALYQRNQKEPVGHAFHVSIAWTFHLPSDELSLKTLSLFRRKRFADMRSWKIEISNVKAKIGNVVTSIPLNASGRPGSLPTGSGPFVG